LRVLECRIPPVVVGLVAAALMWGVRGWPPAIPLAPPDRAAIAGVLALAGLGVDILGLLAFRRARTTVSPLRPDRSTALVTGGIYRFTRNPMYVGLALLLSAWAVQLASPWALLGPAAFVAYITRFQIVPEERLLRSQFGDFAAYAARVRRWL